MRTILDPNMNEEELKNALALAEKDRKLNRKFADYSKAKEFKNSALYTPAISASYIQLVDKLKQLEQNADKAKNKQSNPFHQMNPDFLFDADDLKFINPKSKLFFYPWVLYSAGQGAKTKGMAKKNNWVTKTPRDKRVVMLGDSGGFQVQQQTIKFDAKTTPKRMLQWLEKIADYSMSLDFPTGGIDKGNLVPHVNRLISEGVDIEGIAKANGFSTGYTACLEQSKINNDYFAKHRKSGATSFLNVIQGRNEDESRFWYEEVKNYPFEGWAFAGKHSVILSMTLRRLIQMRDDGNLEGSQLIHFLGVSTLNVNIALTFIQHALQKYTDAKNVQITFDSSTPVEFAKSYQAISGYEFDPDRWTIHADKINLKEHMGDHTLLHELGRVWKGKSLKRKYAQSTLSHCLTLNDLVGKMNPEKGKRVQNTLQFALLINHNTQALIEAFKQANRFLEDKYRSDRPPAIRHLHEYIEFIFKSETPMDHIDEIEVELDALALRGKFGR